MSHLKLLKSRYPVERSSLAGCLREILPEAEIGRFKQAAPHLTSGPRWDLVRETISADDFEAEELLDELAELFQSDDFLHFQLVSIYFTSVDRDTQQVLIHSCSSWYYFEF